MPVQGVEQHTDYDSQAEDNTILNDYFFIFQTKIAECLDTLSQGDVVSSQKSAASLLSMSAPVDASVSDAASYGIDVFLEGFSPPAVTIAQDIAAVVESHDTLTGAIESLESLEDPLLRPELFVYAREELMMLHSLTDSVSDEVGILSGLGIDTADSEAALLEYSSLLFAFEGRLVELETLYDTDFTFFFLQVVKASSIPGHGYEAYGLVYVDGEPVVANPVRVSVNDDLVTVMTDDRGAYSALYVLPAGFSGRSLSFSASTSYNGREYVSNTVVVDFLIDTYLSIDKTYSIEEGIAAVTFFGTLEDEYGVAMDACPITIHANDTLMQSQTDFQGTYSASMELAVESGILVSAYSEFLAPSTSPYDDARSRDLSFYITPESPGLAVDTDVPEFFGRTIRAFIDYPALGAGVLAALIASLLIYLLRVRSRKPTRPGKDALPVDDVSSQDESVGSFERELGLLEKLSNAKESIIFGYGSLLDHLERKQILATTPSMTHTDIGRRLDAISYTKKESPFITSAFEVSRYSNRPVGKNVSKRFFSSLVSISRRMRGDVQ